MEIVWFVMFKIGMLVIIEINSIVVRNKTIIKCWTPAFHDLLLNLSCKPWNNDRSLSAELVNIILLVLNVDVLNAANESTRKRVIFYTVSEYLLLALVSALQAVYIRRLFSKSVALGRVWLQVRNWFSNCLLVKLRRNIGGFCIIMKTLTSFERPLFLRTTKQKHIWQIHGFS